MNAEIEELFRVVGMSEVEVGEDPKYKDNPGREEAKSMVEEAKKNWINCTSLL
jgi:hypothetical protein